MISIVVPVHDEAENIEALIQEIDVACTDLPPWEVIIVDDGSRDGTADIVQNLRSEFPSLRLIQHARAGGQSAAVHSGVAAARGDIMDLSRFDAAPLIAFTAPKETDYGTETDERIPPRCGADCPDQWADAETGGG